MLKRFLVYYKPYMNIFIPDMIASFLVAMIGIVYPIVTRRMLNDFIPNKEYQLIVIFGLTLLCLYAARMLLNYYIQYQGHMMGVFMQAQMRRDMFTHLERLPYKFYDNNETGKIMSRMTNDLMDISELAHHGPENLIISSISIITSFIYLSTINIWLTLIIFMAVPFLLVITYFLRKRMRDAFKRGRQSIAQINASLESSISGIRVTKAFTNYDKEEEKFEEGNASFVSSRRDSYKAMGQFHSGHFIFFLRFIYFWLCWAVFAERRLSLVMVSGGYSLLRCAGFSWRWLLLLQSMGSRYTLQYLQLLGSRIQVQ